MNPHKVQVSPQPVFDYISPEEHKLKEPMEYFILDKTWYAINGFIKWFGVNPWEREVDENGKSRLQMIKPMQFWIRYVIVLLIINALEISLGIYICIFYEAWDAIMKIDSYISESSMDTATGLAGIVVVFFLYGPFVFKMRQFGDGIVQAQEHFKYCNMKTKKSCRKMSICTGMIFLTYLICIATLFGGQAIIMKKEITELPILILILAFIAVMLANIFMVCPLLLFFYVYGDITAQLIEWASMLKDFMLSSITTKGKLENVKKFVAALNHITGVFSFFLFMIMTLELFGLIFTSYRCLSYVLGSYAVTMWEIQMIATSYFIYVLIYILTVWYLASFSQSLLSKIEELKNDFGNIKFCKDMNETEFVDEKNSLYLQLDGFKGFNGENYFTVNNSLITGMVANFMTYLIILIQFKITEMSSAWSSDSIGNKLSDFAKKN